MKRDYIIQRAELILILGALTTVLLLGVCNVSCTVTKTTTDSVTIKILKK